VGRTRPGFIGKATKKDIITVVALHADLDPRIGEPLAEERARIGNLLASPPAGIPPPAVVVDSRRRSIQEDPWMHRRPISGGSSP
jgi:hypothetical protein